MRRTYRGTNVEASFDLDLCIHVAECLRGLPAAFDLERRPWIAPDEATVDEVVDVVTRCPSGALQGRRLEVHFCSLRPRSTEPIGPGADPRRDP